MFSGNSVVVQRHLSFKQILSALIYQNGGLEMINVFLDVSGV